MPFNVPTVLFTIINLAIIIGLILIVVIIINKIIVSQSNTSKSIDNIEKKLDKIIVLLENNKK